MLGNFLPNPNVSFLYERTGSLSIFTHTIWEMETWEEVSQTVHLSFAVFYLGRRLPTESTHFTCVPLWHEPVVLQCDFQASSIYITWEFVRNRNLRASPHTYSIRNSRAEAKQSMFSQALLVILSSLKFRDAHSSAVLPGTGGKVC